MEICFLRWSNHTFRLTKTPAVFKLTVPQLIPLTGRSVPSLSCLLPLLLSFHLVIRLFLYPSLTLDIYPHFSTPHNWCIWHRGPLFLSVSLFIFLPSVIGRLSSSRISEIDLVFTPFSLWMNEWIWRIQLNFLLNSCPLSARDIFQDPLVLRKRVLGKKQVQNYW